MGERGRTDISRTNENCTWREAGVLSAFYGLKGLRHIVLSPTPPTAARRERIEARIRIRSGADYFKLEWTGGNDADFDSNLGLWQF
jgi:hypothetical protein